MTGGSVPAATWFDAMKQIQPQTAVFPPSYPTYVTGQPDSIVPDLTGQSVDQAKATLASAGFKYTPQYDTQANSAPANTVTRTDPPAGQSALPGSAINVYISTGGTTTGG